MPSEQLEIHASIRLSALSAGLRASGICVLHQNTEGRFDLAENIPQSWPVTDLIGRLHSDIFPPETAAAFSAAMERVLAANSQERLQFELGEGLKQRAFQADLSADEHGVVTTISDVTDARTSEIAVSALLREVSHRSKNLLAIVQSVAMQTAHHSGSMQDFLDKFRGRLHALSSVQDLVTESDWRGTYLQTLITAQLSRVGTSRLAHLRVTGANPLLGPNASLHIGLAMHELGINSTRFGALADGQVGQVWVDATITDEPSQPADLVIEWQEAGIETSEAMRPPRFGTLVLERIVPLSVGGTAQFVIEPDSVRYRLVVPSGQFEI